MADDHPNTDPDSSGGKRTPMVRKVVPFMKPVPRKRQRKRKMKIP